MYQHTVVMSTHTLCKYGEVLVTYKFRIINLSLYCHGSIFVILRHHENRECHNFSVSNFNIHWIYVRTPSIPRQSKSGTCPQGAKCDIQGTLSPGEVVMQAVKF